MLQTTLNGGLGYEGKVTLTLMSNDRVLQSKTYKNKGTIQLFRFLGYCLTDSFEEAKRLLPNRILLLNNRSSNPDTANPKDVEPQTYWHEYVQAPAIEVSNADGGQVSVIYSFEISKSAISGDFNQVALYGAGMDYKSEYQDFSAYYFLRTENGAFDTQTATDWSATTVLLIEWELTLSNKNIETQSTRGEEI